MVLDIMKWKQWGCVINSLHSNVKKKAYFYKIIMEEIFKDIPNYKGLYQVSNLGNVKSLRFGKERMLKPHIDGTGYLQVIFCVNSKLKAYKVHKLVSIVFLGGIIDRATNLVVNHIDFNRTNNNAKNLEIITQRENSNKKHLNHTSKYTGVSWFKKRNKWRTQIHINGKPKHLGLFISEYFAHLVYEQKLRNIV